VGAPWCLQGGLYACCLTPVMAHVGCIHQRRTERRWSLRIIEKKKATPVYKSYGSACHWDGRSKLSCAYGAKGTTWRTIALSSLKARLIARRARKLAKPAVSVRQSRISFRNSPASGTSSTMRMRRGPSVRGRIGKWMRRLRLNSWPK